MFCEECGNKVEDTWKVCPNCGYVLHQEMNLSRSCEKDTSIAIEKTPVVEGKKNRYIKNGGFGFL